MTTENYEDQLRPSSPSLSKKAAWPHSLWKYACHFSTPPGDLLSVNVTLLYSWHLSVSKTLFSSCFISWIDRWSSRTAAFNINLFCLLFRPSTQSSPNWWKNTRSREEPNRPCIRRCWVTPLAATRRNIRPSRHGWDLQSLRNRNALISCFYGPDAHPSLITSQILNLYFLFK